MDLSEIKREEKTYLMPTYGRFDIAIESGHGAVAVGSDGREYIDFGSGIGVNSLGYANRGWARAVSHQAKQLQHTSNLYYSEVQVSLADRLCHAAEMSRVFFCNSGAEANECAIKLARKYSFDKYGPGRHQIITLCNSFHGRTITTLTATGQDSFHNYFYPFTEGFRYAPAGDFAALSDLAGDDTCAVLIELVQGEGGVLPLERDYVKQVAEFCAKRDILLMVDEVQTGVARTGSFFAYQHYWIKPDVVTAAKGLGGGLPIGACLASERLGEVLSPGMHGTTFGGNPVACAGASYVLEVVDHPDFLQSVAEKGDYIRRALETMPGVTEVRGLGLMLGAVLKKENAREVAEKALEHGLIVLTAKTVLRLLPPLTITYEEIDRGLAALRKTLAECGE